MIGTRERFISKAVAAVSGWLVLNPLIMIAQPKIYLRVRAKIVCAVGKQAIALGDRPQDFKDLQSKIFLDPGFCISVQNCGKIKVTLSEVGLTGWSDKPRISLHEPMLHDNKPWPRILFPGDTVVTHFGTRLKGHPVLSSMRRVYAKTSNEDEFFGSGPAVRFYIQQETEIEA